MSHHNSVFRVLLSASLLGLACQVQADVSLDPNTRYQTIDRWEGTAQMAQGSPYFNLYKDLLIDKLVNELGISRLRLEIGNSVENTRDFQQEWEQGLITKAQFNCLKYSTVNDNSDPNTINPAGFVWTQFDKKIDAVVLPIRQKLASQGETLWVNLNYVAFTDQLLNSGCSALGVTATNVHRNPQEYAEFMLAVFQHMNTKYGFVPDSIELYLEPDNVTFSPSPWDGTQIGNTLVATQARLAANGFHPKFVGPSTTNAANAPIYFDQIAAVPGALQYLDEISYHRYAGASQTTLQAIANRAVANNKKTSQLEWIGADDGTLHEDLKLGRVSSWAQYTLAYGECSEFAIYGCFDFGTPFSTSNDDGSKYYIPLDAAAPHTTLYTGLRTRLLRQYMAYIRPGAQRIGATSTSGGVDPLAFINANGRYVVVLQDHVTNSAFNLTGLPAGTYGITYTTLSGNLTTRPDQTITAGQPIAIPGLPEWGVLTVFGKTGTSTSPCDLNGDGSSTVGDVQLCVNQAIGITSCGNGDIDHNGSCNVVDVQRVTNAALGSACVSP